MKLGLAIALLLVELSFVALHARDFGLGGLVHFDEGAYACGGLALAVMPFDQAILEGGFSPIIGPPLPFLVLGAAFRLIGIADWVAMLVPLCAGMVTLAATAMLVKLLTGDSLQAVVAALFLALTPYHLVFSRLVLSDGLFLMLAVLSILSFSLASRRGSGWWFVATGITVGLCWNTKYHGFMPLVIIGLTLLIERLVTNGRRTRDAGQQWPRPDTTTPRTAEVAAQESEIDNGGDRIHRDRADKTGLRFDAGGLVVVTILSMVCVIPSVLVISQDIGLQSFVTHRRGFLSADLYRNYVFLIRCLAELTPWPIWPLAVVGMISCARGATRFDRLLLAWTSVWLAAVPWYSPYPRLYLPLAWAVAVLAARGLGTLTGVISRKRNWIPCSVAGFACLGSLWILNGSAGASTDGYRVAASRWAESNLKDGPVLLACRDPMRFYLLSALSAGNAVVPVWSPGFRFDNPRWRGELTCIVDDLHVHDEPLQNWLSERRATIVETIPNRLPWVVRANTPGTPAESEIRIIRVPPHNNY